MSRRRREPTSLSRRLIAAIMAAGWEPYGDPEKYVISRVYAGYWQRSHSAWAWALDYLEDGPAKTDAALIGSQWPATECARGCHFHGGAVYPNSLSSESPPLGSAERSEPKAIQSKPNPNPNLPLRVER